jgi:glycine/D-amino acid oxidase-like deaminating enzyme/nitrite reductase/ring-hydroxylating ferredoxin subunit
MPRSEPSPPSADLDPKGRDSAGVTESCWTATHAPIRTRRLAEKESADVCVVGGGISGLTTAYFLSISGSDVVVLEDGALGSGETGRTTAHFTNALDDRYHTIAKKHGKAAARKAAQSHTKAIETVASIVEEEKIRCHMERVDGYLFLHPSDKPKSLDDELDTCRAIGLDVDRVASAPHFDSGPALRFPDQLQLHILEYLAGLKRAIERQGGRIYTDTHCRFPEGKLKANDQPVKADKVVICTNAPVTTKLAIHAKQLAFRTYVIAAEAPKSIPRAMWWDTGDYEAPSPFPPYHYVRLQRFADGRTLLIAGGQDHKVGVHEHVDADLYDALETWTRERFPELGATVHRWSGQVFEPADHLAFIGAEPVQRGRYLASGDSGNGMTHGTLAGLILHDLVLGRSSPYEDLYDPTRRNVRSAGALLREHVGMVKKLGRYLAPGDVASAADLAPGQGAVFGKPMPKAVYRDDDGKLHACSAICPHLKCVVAWNPYERSFDCPCHGSRFTATGKVVCGPSNADLEEVELDEKERGPGRKQGARPAQGKRTHRRKTEVAGPRRPKRV